MVRKYKIQLFNSIISICHIPDTIIYTIEAVAGPDEILLMAKNGYYIQILDEVGDAIATGYSRKILSTSSTTTDLYSAALEDYMTT
ncbi:MAG: hypothetical protein M3Y53_04530 [Thermoproteota archaeon]|nr:hypothetical protein [Thermoproteota archaeon]